jgi:cyclic pyranopterin phosphate synthase
MSKTIEKFIEKSSLETLQLIVGYDCNNFCLFCMETDRAGRRREVKKFLKKRIYQVLEENTHIKKVVFTSGEPTLNPQIFNYAKRAKELGYKRIEIISNGRMFSHKDYCAELIEAGVNEFIISIHGHNKKIHEAMSRTPGSFEQTEQGLSNMSWFRSRRPIRLSVNHVLTKYNYKFSGDFLEFLRNYFLDDAVLKTVRMSESVERTAGPMIAPRYEEVAKILEELYRKTPRLFLSRLRLKDNYIYVYDLPFCCYRNIGQLFGAGEKVLLDINNQTVMMDYSKNKVKDKRCKLCKHNAICGGVYKGYIEKYGWNEFMPIKK